MSEKSVLKQSAVFLRQSARLSIQPRPINLAERRQIYNHLQKYGDILLFKSLYYDRTVHAPDSALLIYRNHDSLQRLRQDSPVTVKITRRDFDPTILHWTFLDLDKKASPLDLGPRLPDLNKDDPARRKAPIPTRRLKFDLNTIDAYGNEQNPNIVGEEVEQAESEVEFKIWTHYWQNTHRDPLKHQPFWGPFTIQSSMLQQDLKDQVPILALSDTNVHRKPILTSVLNRQADRISKRKTLREVYEEGIELNKRRQ